MEMYSLFEVCLNASTQLFTFFIGPHVFSRGECAIAAGVCEPYNVSFRLHVCQRIFVVVAFLAPKRLSSCGGRREERGRRTPAFLSPVLPFTSLSSARVVRRERILR